MLETVELCERLQDTCVRIVVLDGEKRVSFGTGVLISTTGAVITAKHVVARRSKLYSGIIKVQTRHEEGWSTYQCVSLPGLCIDTGSSEALPFPIDLAALMPVEAPARATPCLPLSSSIVPLGTDVIVAGFSDDTFFPLSFKDSIDTRRLEGMDLDKFFRENEWRFRQLLCKRAIIGSRWRLTLNNYVAGRSLNSATYTLDNDISYGASGGPVVDIFGQLVAVVCEKGVADASKFRIATQTGDLEKLPSGTSYALDHSLITSLINPPAPLAKSDREEGAGSEDALKNAPVKQIVG